MNLTDGCKKVKTYILPRVGKYHPMKRHFRLLFRSDSKSETEIS